MRKVISIISIVLFLTISALSQEAKQFKPVVLQIAAPIYPQPAIALNLEEKILVQIRINEEGKVKSTTFNRGAKVFHTVIDDALKQWKFEESTEKERRVSISFVFTLLPSDSKSYTSMIFRSPDTIEVFARKVKILDTADKKSQR